ncbi:CheR family methyltransferase [Halocola ammonii]
MTKPKNKLSDQYIIGVGASAGGLEAIYKLFNSPSPKNTSFIIIQHLPPHYKSNTSELLAKHSGQKVIEVKNDMSIQPGTIYVMSEKKNVVIKNGTIILEDSKEPHNNVIDLFFSSIAQDYGAKSIGVILSGSNEDGTKGSDAIKQAGGCVIAQDPGTTFFGNMPASIITSGYADVVVAPEFIMKEIKEYLNHKALYSQFTDNNEKDLLEVISLIKDHSSLNFADYKRTTLVRRIIKKMNAGKFDSLPKYIEFLKEKPDEVKALAKEFLISVTSFFRDIEPFEILQETLPEVIKNKEPDAPLKVWSIGCATGEEAYSLAMVIDEFLTEKKKSIEVKIFATDVDHEALAVGSKGIYPKSIEKDISSGRLSKYFDKEDGKYKVKERLRQMLIFAEHDITKHPPYYKLDIISCRNLLIYLNPFLQKKVLSTLHFCLNDGGYLHLGPSESLGNVKGSFKEISKKWKIFKNVKPTSFLENGTYSPPSYTRQAPRPVPAEKPERNEMQNHLYSVLNNELLSELNYAGVCVDEDFKIVKALGDYKKYLLPEMFNFELLELLPRELSIATSSSMKRAVKEKKEIVLKQVKFSRDKKAYSVDIIVKVLPETKNSGKLLLVLYKDRKVVKKSSKQKEQEVFDESLFAERYVTELEEELKEARQKLEEAEDSLKVSVDNAQAYNEELISNNEELQSTNEEVQSINEELQTVNNDNQQKMKQLSDLNDELNNYFRSTTNSQLYVDRNLIIRKFTPTAFKQINLKESDIGRPLHDISSNIKFTTLISDIEEVMATSNRYDGEVQTLNDQWYQMSINPYVRKKGNKTDGVVITFNDITELKKTQEILTRIIHDHDTFIHSVSHDLRGEVGNLLLSSKHLYQNFDQMNNDEVKNIGSFVYRSAQGLVNVINDLTDIALTEKEIREEHSQDISVKTLLKEIKTTLSDQLKESKAVLKTDFEVDKINFMRKNLRSVILNLLSNAIKYRSPDRRLEVVVRTREVEGYITLSVTDNGIGIKEDKLRDIFSKYKRVHGKQPQNIEGAGIGMYLVKRRMEIAKGKIEVSSEPKVGTTFTASFPKN